MGYVNTVAFHTRSQARMAQEQPLLLDGILLDAEVPAAGGVTQLIVRNGVPRQRPALERAPIDADFEELCGLYGWGSSISHAVSKATGSVKKTVKKAAAKVPAVVAKAATKAVAAAPKVAATVGKAVASGTTAVGTKALSAAAQVGQRAISAAPTILPAIATGGISLVAQKGLPALMGGAQQPASASSGEIVYQDANGNPISKAQYDALMAQYQAAQQTGGATTYLDADGNVITEAEYNAQMAALNTTPATPAWPNALAAQPAASSPGSTFSQGAVGQSSPMGYGYGGGYGGGSDIISSDPYGDPFADNGGSDAGIDDAMSANDGDYGMVDEGDSGDDYSDLNSPDVVMDDEEADWYSGDESAPDGGSDEFGVGSWFSGAVDRVRNVVAKGAPIAGAAIGTVIAPGAGTAVGATAGDLVGQALTKKDAAPSATTAMPKQSMADATQPLAPRPDRTLPWVIGGSAAGLAFLGLVLFIATRRPAPAAAPAKANPRRWRR